MNSSLHSGGMLDFCRTYFSEGTITSSKYSVFADQEYGVKNSEFRIFSLNMHVVHIYLLSNREILEGLLFDSRRN